MQINYIAQEHNTVTLLGLKSEPYNLDSIELIIWPSHLSLISIYVDPLSPNSDKHLIYPNAIILNQTLGSGK